MAAIQNTQSPIGRSTFHGDSRVSGSPGHNWSSWLTASANTGHARE